jgi:hypothetical protein
MNILDFVLLEDSLDAVVVASAHSSVVGQLDVEGKHHGVVQCFKPDWQSLLNFVH